MSKFELRSHALYQDVHCESTGVTDVASINTHLRAVVRSSSETPSRFVASAMVQMPPPPTWSKSKAVQPDVDLQSLPHWFGLL